MRADGRLRWWEGVASPGPGGYVLAVLVSALALGPLIAVQLLPGVVRGEETPGSLLAGMALVAIFATVLSAPIAVPGVAVVHLVCRRVRDQRVHVLVAGLVGAAAVLVWGALTGEGVDGWFSLSLGIATACGRAAVVPLARRRVRRTPVPVDDDFRAGPPAC